MDVLGSHSRSYLGTADEVVAVATASGKTLIAIFGQSLATSYGTVATLTDSTLALAYPAVQMRSRQSVGYTDNPPTWTDNNGDLDSIIFEGNDGIGMEATLLRDLDRAQPGKFALARFALGGSSAAQWSPSGTYPSNDATNMFTQWIAFVDAARVALSCTGVVWCFEQGAADAKASGTANAYAAFLTQLVTALRVAYPVSPFVYGLMMSGLSDVTYPYKSTVRAAQTAFEGTMTSTRLVNEDVMTFNGIAGHPNGNEFAIMGHLWSPHVAAMLGFRIPPLSQFTFSPSNLVVTFTDTSLAPGSTVTAWLWDFGDGTTSTSQNPTRTYAGAGTYTVSLTATNATGETHTSSQSVIASSLSVTRDATSNKYVPANGTEFGSLLTSLGNPLATPNSLWLAQEDGTAGQINLADSIGSVAMTWSSTAAAYQVAVAGWTRKAVAAAQGSTTKFAAGAGVGPNPTNTSSLWLWFVDVTATPATARQLMAVGGGSAFFDGSLAINVGGVMRVRCSGATVDGTVDVATGGVRPFFLQYDRTHGIIRGGCDADIVTGTYASTVTDSFKGVFAGGGGTAAAASAVWGCMWSGANAEVGTAAIKTLLQGMGWTVAW